MCKSVVVDLIWIYYVDVVAFKLCHCIAESNEGGLMPDKSKDFKEGGLTPDKSNDFNEGGLMPDKSNDDFNEGSLMLSWYHMHTYIAFCWVVVVALSSRRCCIVDVVAALFAWS